MICKNCMKDIPEDALFCSNCGAKVQSVDTEKVLQFANGTKFEKTKGYVNEKPMKKKGTGCLIVLLIISIAFLVTTIILNATSKSRLAIVMDLDKEQEAAINVVFEKCGIKKVVSVEKITENKKYTEFYIEDEETSSFNENKEIDVWITNKSKKVQEISYCGVIVYEDGKVESPLPDNYVANNERYSYWLASTRAISQFLNYPDSAEFSMEYKSRFGVHKEDVFVQGTVQASNAFGVKETLDYQVNFDRKTNDVVYLRLGDTEYITKD